MGLIMLTGATGFIGRSVCESLTRAGRQVRAVSRNPGKLEGVAAGCAETAVGEIGPETRWGDALAGVDSIVHLAARVHVMTDTAVDPLAEFRRVNTAGTLHLARQAAAAGARRFVYLSSIKVNGEVTLTGRPFVETDHPAPLDPYGISKLEAEQGLRDLAAATGMEVVIIRPPLVYGPGVGANFFRLLRLVERGWPLPLGAVDNRRSLVALDNLVDLLATCIDHPAAAGQTFLVSDGEDLSIPELIRRLARTMGRPDRLWPVPVPLLRLGGRLLGHSAEVARLVGSLQVDIEHTCRTLGWRPPITVDEGLRRAVECLSNHDG